MSETQDLQQQELEIRRRDVPWRFHGAWCVILICAMVATILWLMSGRDPDFRIGLLDTLVGLALAVPAGWVAGGANVAVTRQMILKTVGPWALGQIERGWLRESLSQYALWFVSFVLGIVLSVLASLGLRHWLQLGWPYFGPPAGGAMGAAGFLWAGALWYRYARWYYGLPK